MDVIVHEENFTRTKVSKILVRIFHFAYFYHLCHLRWPAGKPAGCLHVTGVIIMPVKVGCATCISMVNYVLSACIHCVAFKLPNITGNKLPYKIAGHPLLRNG